MLGRPDLFHVAAAARLWMDLNRPVPTYRLRFRDPRNTDVYVAQSTGEVVQRRPDFWRLFDRILAVHMFAFTGVKPLDMAMSALFQLSVLTSPVVRAHAACAPTAASESRAGAPCSARRISDSPRPRPARPARPARARREVA